MQAVKDYLEFIGNVGLFAKRAALRSVVPPFEWEQLWIQVDEIGWKSLPIILPAGFAIGLVLTLHTRASMIRFGAESLIPALQSLSFFNELGPLVTSLLVAGRVGAGIAAVLAEMRASEQIDAIEVFSIDSFKMLVVPRLLACILVLPVLTVFADVAGLLGGYVIEHTASHSSLTLYLSLAFSDITWAGFLPPTLKTMVFGFIIGIVSCFYGYTTDEGASGVGKAATNSVVLSSLLIILTDVVLVKLILFLFPDTAI